MISVLEYMGFGSSFISWVRLLYSRVSSKVLVNGHPSSSFSVTRGVRQGCPMSPLLYVLVAESLACAIRADPGVVGFPLPGSATESVKLSQYADDTSSLVTTASSIDRLFLLFDRYGKASGAKRNASKCHGLLLGPWRNRSFPHPIQWSALDITVLGSTIGKPEGWDPSIKRLKNVVSSWRARSLTFRGKAVICNVLGLSIFWYLASLVTLPVSAVASIQQVIFPFVWGKRQRGPISRITLALPVSAGGIGIVSIPRKVTSSRFRWAKRFFCQPCRT